MTDVATLMICEQTVAKISVVMKNSILLVDQREKQGYNSDISGV